MSDATLRVLVGLVIAMLLIFQIGTIITDIYGAAWGVVATVLVIAVLFVAARLNKLSDNKSLWFLMPLLLFSAATIGIIIWNSIVEESGWLDVIISLTPFLLGFAAPVVLLLVVYFELRKRVKKNS